MTTTIGFGSPNKANSYSVHGSALGAKEVDATRKNLGWPYEPFHVPEEVQKYEIKKVAFASFLKLSLDPFMRFLYFAGIGAATSLRELPLKLNGMPSLQSMRINTKKMRQN